MRLHPFDLLASGRRMARGGCRFKSGRRAIHDNEKPVDDFCARAAALVPHRALAPRLRQQAVDLALRFSQFGQGFLLGQPMPEQRFIAMLRRRSGTPARELPAAAR